MIAYNRWICSERRFCNAAVHGARTLALLTDRQIAAVDNPPCFLSVQTGDAMCFNKGEIVVLSVSAGTAIDKK